MTQSEWKNCYLTINYISDLSGLDTNLTPTDSRHLKSASLQALLSVNERFAAMWKKLLGLFDVKGSSFLEHENVFHRSKV